MHALSAWHLEKSRIMNHKRNVETLSLICKFQNSVADLLIFRMVVEYISLLYDFL